jgi:hypothetical protein
VGSRVDHCAQSGLARYRDLSARPEFARLESVDLLQSRLPGLSSDDADRVAGALGDLPLAVDQAANLLADTGMTITGYLKLLTEQAVPVLSRGRVDDAEPSVAASWAVAFDRLAADDLAALQLLTLMAWLDRGPVPLRVFTEKPHLLPSPLKEIAADPLMLADRLASLRRPGMARTRQALGLLHRVRVDCCRPVPLTSSSSPSAGRQSPSGYSPPSFRWYGATRPSGEIWRALLPHVLRRYRFLRCVDR